MSLPPVENQYPSFTAFDTMIDVKVGEEPSTKTFAMHNGVLCFYSQYLSKALANDRWVEGKSGVINLSTEQIDVFEMFIYWVYTRRLRSPNQKGPQSLSVNEIIDVWLFADQFTETAS